VTCGVTATSSWFTLPQPRRYCAVRSLPRSNYYKFGEFATKNGRFNRYLPYLSQGWTLAAQLDESSYLASVPFDAQLRVTVMEIFHPSSDPVAKGGFPGMTAKPDTLHFSRNGYHYPDFHCSPPISQNRTAPPVKPDATTFRTVIDFDPLTFGHDKIDGSTYGTFHNLMVVIEYAGPLC